jgi:hypothetical protein
MEKSMPAEPSVLNSAVQPIDPGAVVDAALRCIYSVYGPGFLEFIDFAEAIRADQEAKEELEELLHTVRSGEDDEDGRRAFGLGMVAGLILAANTGISLKVPPLAELKATLGAQEAQCEAMRQTAPGASQVA